MHRSSRTARMHRSSPLSTVQGPTKFGTCVGWWREARAGHIILVPTFWHNNVYGSSPRDQIMYHSLGMRL